MEISKTQILHENINKSGYKNLKNERHVRMKDMRDPTIKILKISNIKQDLLKIKALFLIESQS
ncbi:hypothetical protein BT0002_10740 [Helicobacter pylori]